jgi:hypothetical protein
METLHTKNPNQSRIALQPLADQQSLGHWGQNRYDFHWCEDPIPRALVLHREHQQDALRFSWPGDGLVGAMATRTLDL